MNVEGNQLMAPMNTKLNLQLAQLLALRVTNRLMTQSLEHPWQVDTILWNKEYLPHTVSLFGVSAANIVNVVSEGNQPVGQGSQLLSSVSGVQKLHLGVAQRQETAACLPACLLVCLPASPFRAAHRGPAAAAAHHAAAVAVHRPAAELLQSLGL